MTEENVPLSVYRAAYVGELDSIMSYSLRYVEEMDSDLVVRLHPFSAQPLHNQSQPSAIGPRMTTFDGFLPTNV